MCDTETGRLAADSSQSTERICVYTLENTCLNVIVYNEQWSIQLQLQYIHAEKISFFLTFFPKTLSLQINKYNNSCWFFYASLISCVIQMY